MKRQTNKFSEEGVTIRKMGLYQVKDVGGQSIKLRSTAHRKQKGH